MQRAIIGTILVVLVALPGVALADHQPIDVPRDPERPGPGAEVVDLLDPIKDVLSGRSWLMAEGIDPGLARRPGWHPLTRMDWDALDHLFTAPDITGPMGTRLQAPAAAALVPFREPAPAFSRDLLITRDLSRTPIQTEPHLAVNPNDPEHLVVGVIDYNFPTVSSYVSIDGGQAWDGPNQVPYLLDDRTSGGDPVVAFDRDGGVHFASISIGIEEFTFGPVVSFALVSSIVMANSPDGGLTWPRTVSTARSGVETRDLRLDPVGRLRGTLATSFLDKPWLAVGPHADDPERDVLYVTYTHFETLYEILWIGEVPTFLPTATESTIRLVRSEDGGETWSDPVGVSPTVTRAFGEVEQPAELPTALAGTKRVVQGSQPVVASDGTVHVAWLDSTDDGSMEGDGEIHLARSDDGGRSFSDSVTAATFNEIGFRPRTAFFRYWGASFPQLAIGPDDELYVVYTGRPDDRAADDGDIFFIRSRDGGDSWTQPRRLNDDDGDALQFFPAIDVGPDGVIHAMWGDMRDDPSQASYHIYYSSSDDGGATWGFEAEELGVRVADARVTDFPSNPNFGFPLGLFIGDYFAISATDDDVYMVWADTRLGEFGPMNQKIGFARQRPVRTPDVFLSPAAGPGGQEITIQGFDFQPDVNVFLQLEDATIAMARTNQHGEFQARLFMPVTGEGGQAVTVIDDSGNRASTSFFSEFGFGSLQDRLHWAELAGGPPDEFLSDIAAVRALLEENRTRTGAGLLTGLAAFLIAVALSAIVATLLIRPRRPTSVFAPGEVVVADDPPDD